MRNRLGIFIRCRRPFWRLRRGGCIRTRGQPAVLGGSISTMALTPGTRFGPYEIAALIGVGRHGRGLSGARPDPRTRRRASRCCPNLRTDADRLARLQREAKCWRHSVTTTSLISMGSSAATGDGARHGARRRPDACRAHRAGPVPPTRRSPLRCRSPARSKPRTRKASCIAI